MTTINSQEDFLRALSENPEWKAAVRARILGEELLQLPAKFDAFVAEMTGFVAEQKQFNAEMKAFVAEQKQFNAEMKAFVAEMTGFVAEQKQFNAEMKAFVADQKRFNARAEHEFGRSRGHYAREVTIRRAESVALLMGLEYIRTVSSVELTRMALTAAQGQAISGDLKSFQNADLVIEATDEKTVQYVAIEISFTADPRDTNRALRNASLLTEFTGRPARAAIASTRNDNSISWQITSGDVYWHEIEERDMDPE